MDDQCACVAAAGDALDACAAPQAPSLKVESASEAPTPSFSSIKPLVEHPVPFTEELPVDVSPIFACRLGGEFSFMCTLRMDGIGPWSRIFDFSLTADEDSITAGAVGLSNDLHFTVFQGKKPISVRVDGFFELGKEFTMLCTASASGHMKVFKDGVLVGENADGMAPPQMDRPRMTVGGHYMFHDQVFRGSLRDVKVWNQEVSWGELKASSASKVDGEFTSDIVEVVAPSENSEGVCVLDKVLAEQVETSPTSEPDDGLRGSREAVDPTSEIDEDVEAKIPTIGDLVETPKGSEEGLARQFDADVAPVEGDDGVPVACS